MADCGDGEWRGCIDGVWYEPCDHKDCTGMCEYAGECQCTGCARERCCKAANDG